MEVIENKYGEPYIEISKINKFYNLCKVSGKKEEINIEVSYIPGKTLLELESYRNFFDKEWNMYIEELAFYVYNYIHDLIKPIYLKVTIFLQEKTLTPWSVTFKTL